jgi:hypothetical protein
MKYASSEDRLNPETPPDADETTLGGYAAIHGRAAAFEAHDGEPYTVGLETDDAGEEGGEVTGYLVFLRWSRTGSAIMGHLVSDDLVTADSHGEARAALEALPLHDVRKLLDEAIAREREEQAEDPQAGDRRSWPGTEGFTPGD